MAWIRSLVVLMTAAALELVVAAPYLGARALAGRVELVAMQSERRLLDQTQSQSAGPAADLAGLFAEGEAALRAGDLERAEGAFKKVLAADPNAAGAYANLGVIAMRRQQWGRALEMLRKAERLAPNVAGIRLNIGLIYYRQND